MAPEKTEDNFAEEVEDRLENLFGEDDLDEGPPDEPKDAGDSPLRELKAIVLSIDWEITDEAMIRFVEQIAELQDVFKEDKIVLVFLQLLGSIGEYIRVNLGKSHPDAFKLLSTLYSNLDTVVHAEQMSDAERRKVLSAELAKYKQLKGQLVSETPPAEAKASASETNEEPDDSDEIMEASDEIIEASDEIIEAPDEIIEAPDEIIEAPDEIIEAPDEIMEVSDEIIESSDESFEAPDEILETSDDVIGASKQIELPEETNPEVVNAIEDFKQLIQSEMQALRKEIQQLKKSLSEKE